MNPYLLETLNIWTKLLQKVDPSELLSSSIEWQKSDSVLKVNTHSIPLDENQEIYLSGTGKASAGMALGVEIVLGEELKAGMVISTPHPIHHPEKTKLLFGTHPYPDEKSFQSTEKLLSYIKRIPKGSLLINLISGGTSALLCRPQPEIAESDISRLHRLLVTSGASIDQINTVRKTVSSVKGGRMLKEMKHLQLLDLIISDVPDDNPEDIGSGPTTPQSLSFRNAADVLHSLGIRSQLSDPLLAYIDKKAGEEQQNGTEATADIDGHRSYILSSAKMVAAEAEKLLRNNGFTVSSEKEPWSGDIKKFEIAILERLNRMLEESNFPSAHVFFGECTVSVSGSGKGGRNQELALRMARHLKDYDRKILFMSAGSDGIDGPTDAAGAIVDETTWSEGEERGANPQACLDNNDSYSFFNNTEWHIKTGATGNNVMDIQFLMIK